LTPSATHIELLFHTEGAALAAIQIHLHHVTGRSFCFVDQASDSPTNVAKNVPHCPTFFQGVSCASSDALHCSTKGSSSAAEGGAQTLVFDDIVLHKIANLAQQAAEALAVLRWWC
jgi:hypothetical protein